MTDHETGNSFKLNIGGPSIILLLTVLSLSLFGVLSVRAAYNGLKLSKSSVSAVETYYEACGRAQELIYQIRERAAELPVKDNASAEQTETALRKLEGVSLVADGRVSFEVPVRDGMTLSVTLAGNSDYTGLEIVEHVMKVESMGGYDGAGFEIFDFEIN